MWWKQYLFHQCAQWNYRWFSTILIPKLFRSLHSWLFKFAFGGLEKITWHWGCPCSEWFFWWFCITSNPTTFQFSGCIVCFCFVIILREPPCWQIKSVRWFCHSSVVKNSHSTCSVSVGDIYNLIMICWTVISAYSVHVLYDNFRQSLSRVSVCNW